MIDPVSDLLTCVRTLLLLLLLNRQQRAIWGSCCNQSGTSDCAGPVVGTIYRTGFDPQHVAARDDPSIRLLLLRSGAANLAWGMCIFGDADCWRGCVCATND